jgi:hypothetical protein
VPPTQAPASSSEERKGDGEKRMRGDRHRDKSERKAEKERRKAERKAEKERRKAERKAEKENRKAEKKSGNRMTTTMIKMTTMTRMTTGMMIVARKTASTEVKGSTES